MIQWERQKIRLWFYSVNIIRTNQNKGVRRDKNTRIFFWICAKLSRALLAPDLESVGRCCSISSITLSSSSSCRPSSSCWPSSSCRSSSSCWLSRWRFSSSPRLCLELWLFGLCKCWLWFEWRRRRLWAPPCCLWWGLRSRPWCSCLAVLYGTKTSPGWCLLDTFFRDGRRGKWDGGLGNWDGRLGNCNWRNQWHGKDCDARDIFLLVSIYIYYLQGFVYCIVCTFMGIKGWLEPQVSLSKVCFCQVQIFGEL